MVAVQVSRMLEAVLMDCTAGSVMLEAEVPEPLAMETV